MYDDLSSQVARLEDIALRLERNQERHAREAEGRDAKALIYLERLYSNAGESAAESRRRLFADIPAAEGALRLHQLATARLMHELDKIFSLLGIEYWFAYGTLVAALSRHGFIPWDDDIDICIMRDDLDRLKAHLEGDENFQVTLMYDRYVFCRQVRFCLRDSRIPAFIDLSIWDYATDASREKDDEIRRLRLELMEALSHAEGLDYWAERPCLFAPGSGYCTQIVPVDIGEQDRVRTIETAARIEEVLASYQRRAHDAGILCTREQAGAVAYALDNIYDAPWRQILWEKEMMLPTRLCPFESYEFRVPRQAEEVMQRCYPGSPYLPDDIVGHEHFDRGTVESREAREALVRFIDAGRVDAG